MNSAGVSTSRPKVLVALHVCEPAAWDDVHRYLARLDYYDLVLASCSEGMELPRRDQAYDRAQVIDHDADGQDVGDFVNALKVVDLGAYDLVLKLIAGQRHMRQTRDAWMQRMDQLLGTDDADQRIRQMIRQDPVVGLVIAQAADAATEEWPPRDGAFYEVFWAKPLALTKLRAGLSEMAAGNAGPHQAREALLQAIPERVDSAGYDVRVIGGNDGNYIPLTIGQRQIKLLAFYLPQFHPVPENDAWWGKGFTEWTQVVRARPLYGGHRQPRLPTDMGFYDLRVPETREAQAELARQYGIYGFCYYYYWFNGRRILERPLNEVVASGVPDFPFCICWANENWTRRWDGLDDDILLKQTYSADASRRFIWDAMPLLQDRRYVRYQGKPILLVYRIRDVPDVQRMLEIWRQECQSAGVGDIHIAGVRFWDIVDVRRYGFDAAVDFPPHHVAVRKLHREVSGLVPGFQGLIYDYAHVVRRNLETRGHGYGELAHRGAMLAWDNTPRRGKGAHIAHGASPQLYRQWLSGIIDQEMRYNSASESIVFINAWNEWAEGANLEPDTEFASGFLEATRDALFDAAAAWARKPEAGSGP